MICALFFKKLTLKVMFLTVFLWKEMSLLAMNSLYEKRGNGGYLWSEA